MKFIIKHASRGRIRIQACQRRMTLEQADLLEAWLQGLGQVTEAAVHERTRCAVIRYTGPREQLLQALGQFTWAKAAPPRVKYLGGMHCASPVCEAA